MVKLGRRGSALKLLFLLCGVIEATSGECEQDDQSYDYRERGPKVWKKLFPTCKEKRQSPIALDTSAVTIRHTPTLQWFNWHNVPTNMTLENTGHSVMLTPSWDSPEDWPYVYLSCLPCLNTCIQKIVAQIHFHWGETDDVGSEHIVNGQHYPFEMHVVLFSRDYGNLSNAIASEEQTAVAVVTYLFKISDTPNAGLNDLVVSYLPDIKNCGDKVDVVPRKLQELVPEFNRNFFRYNGTLTTPPCARVAMFLISKEPLPITSDQLPPFRGINDISGRPLIRNYRDPQKIDGREIQLIL